jgi:hypothetical protein
MQEYRPDRVVGVLTTLITVAFYGLLSVGGLVLIATLALKLFAAGDREWEWGLPVPVVVQEAEVTVQSPWGAGSLEVEDARGSLRLPIAILPWWLFALLWTHAATAGGLMVLFLHHLRRIFQRVRDGIPFDAENAMRLRRLGMVLLALALLNGVAELVVALAVGGNLSDGSISVPAALPIDMSLVFVALVLIALAAIFRRGAELEDEQSLVV